MPGPEGIGNRRAHNAAGGEIEAIVDECRMQNLWSERCRQM
jgi:hypothetical protein